MTLSPAMLRVIRYAIVGASGALLQVAVLWLWVSVLGMSSYYLAGVWIGFCLALAITFPLQKYWTFKDRKTQAHRQFGWYTLIALGNLAANTLLLSLAKHIIEYLHADFFRVWYLIAECVIVVGIALSSFLVNRAITFKETTAELGRTESDA